MAEVVAEFFEVLLPNGVYPTNIEELIPYMSNVTVAVCLVSGVFAVIGNLFKTILTWNRWTPD